MIKTNLLYCELSGLMLLQLISDPNKDALTLTNKRTKDMKDKINSDNHTEDQEWQ